MFGMKSVSSSTSAGATGAATPSPVRLAPLSSDNLSSDELCLLAGAPDAASRGLLWNVDSTVVMSRAGWDFLWPTMNNVWTVNGRTTSSSSNNNNHNSSDGTRGKSKSRRRRRPSSGDEPDSGSEDEGLIETVYFVCRTSKPRARGAAATGPSETIQHRRQRLLSNASDNHAPPSSAAAPVASTGGGGKKTKKSKKRPLPLEPTGCEARLVVHFYSDHVVVKPGRKNICHCGHDRIESDLWKRSTWIRAALMRLIDRGHSSTQVMAVVMGRQVQDSYGYLGFDAVTKKDVDNAVRDYRAVVRSGAAWKLHPVATGAGVENCDPTKVSMADIIAAVETESAALPDPAPVDLPIDSESTLSVGGPGAAGDLLRSVSHDDDFLVVSAGALAPAAAADVNRRTDDGTASPTGGSSQFSDFEPPSFLFSSFGAANAAHADPSPAVPTAFDLEAAIWQVPAPTLSMSGTVVGSNAGSAQVVSEVLASLGMDSRSFGALQQQQQQQQQQQPIDLSSTLSYSSSSSFDDCASNKVLGEVPAAGSKRTFGVASLDGLDDGAAEWFGATNVADFSVVDAGCPAPKRQKVVSDGVAATARLSCYNYGLLVGGGDALGAFNGGYGGSNAANNANNINNNNGGVFATWDLSSMLA